MTNAELQALTKQWSLKYFERPFTHQVIFNPRLKTTGGRYHLDDHHIDINPLMLTEFDLANLKKVVLHELCHYHLHLAGSGYRHRDREFQALLALVGGSRYAPPTSKAKRRAPLRWAYQCQRCGKVIARRRRFNPACYRCGYCGGKIKFTGELKKV